MAIDILDELDLSHLRATGLQSSEEELPEAEQAPPGTSSSIHYANILVDLKLHAILKLN